MWTLHYIEDTTAPADRQILIGKHDDEASAYLAWVFVCGGSLEGFYVTNPAGEIVHADDWTRQVFVRRLSVLIGGKP
jgi:hypothetical protein